MLSAALDILRRIGRNLRGSDTTIRACITGGVAVSWWLNGLRATHDLDVLFSHRLLIEQRLSAPMVCADGTAQGHLFFDYSYGGCFALFQEDYWKRAHFLDRFDNLEVFVLAPNDLALSKLSRCSAIDRWDMQKLADAGLLDQEAIRALAADAMKEYIGDPKNLEYGLLRAVQDNVRHEPSTSLPPLTMHAVTLPEYPDMASVLDAYTAGSPGTEPRVADALLATVVAMFLDWQAWKRDLRPWATSPEACARLLYAATFVRECFDRTPPNEGLEEIMDWLRPRAGEGTLLFSDMQCELENDVVARAARVRSSLYPNDIRGLVDHGEMRFVKINE